MCVSFSLSLPILSLYMGSSYKTHHHLWFSSHEPRGVTNSSCGFTCTCMLKPRARARGMPETSALAGGSMEISPAGCDEWAHQLKKSDNPISPLPSSPMFFTLSLTLLYLFLAALWYFYWLSQCFHPHLFELPLTQTHYKHRLSTCDTRVV